MPWFRINQFEANGGSVGDLPAQAIPPSIFTDAHNVRFLDGAVEKASGMAEQFGTPPLMPYYLLSSQENDGIRRLFIAGLTQIYYYLSGSFNDCSRVVGGAYTAGVNNVWTGGVLHGVPVLNNGTDKPQAWDKASTKFIDMPNWPATYLAKSLRPFKNYLVAMNITDGATQYPHNVLWSHPADPGSVPGASGWNIADPTKDAGMAPLSDTPGHVLDGQALGDSFAVYKEDATYMMQFVGAPYIFKFRPILRESGVLAQNCIVEVLGRHVVLTTDDVVVFDGTQAESIINKKWRRELFASISISDYAKSYLAVFPALREVWICISTAAGYPPNLAFVWNWKSNTWAKRDIPFSQSIIAAFPPDPVGSTWDSDSATWDSDGEGWSAFSLRGKASVIAGTTGTKLYTLGVGELFGDVAMQTRLAHESFDFASKEVPDAADAVKHVSKLRPKIVADAGTVLKFEIGVQMNLNDAIEWGEVQTFIVGTTTELCMGRNGRYISWRITGNGAQTWRLEAMDFLVQGGGNF